MTEMRQAIEFAVSVVELAQSNMLKRKTDILYSNFWIVGSDRLVSEVLDGLEIYREDTRRISEVTLIVPKVLVSRLKSAKELAGYLTCGAIFFTQDQPRLLSSVRSSVRKSAKWTQGSVLELNIEDNHGLPNNQQSAYAFADTSNR